MPLVTSNHTRQYRVADRTAHAEKGRIMFNVSTTHKDRTCQRIKRRDFLRIGGIGMLGGLTLPMLLEAKAHAAAAGHVVKDKSVVFLFLSGGPSHIEFFDPKMDAPA